MIFEIDNVELHLRNKLILSGIYLKAEAGKVTGILGRNGCGKSCLMEIIFGNLKPKNKLTRIDNTPVLEPLYQTKQVKYLPQYSFLSNSFTLHKTFKTYQVDWIAFISMFPNFSNYKNFKPRLLSTGERRLVELYLVLKSPSKIILLDEPTNNLDMDGLYHLQTLIQMTDKTCVVISQDEDFLNSFTDSGKSLFI